MKSRASIVCVALVLASLGFAPVGCMPVPEDQDGAQAGTGLGWPEFDKCICVIRGTKGNEGVNGVVFFTQKPDGVEVSAEISGLEPGTVHALHVHEFGDCNCDDGKCTGGHFNPHGKKHGGPNDAERHAGDLGNVRAGADGKAVYKYVDRVIKLKGSASILGRGLTLHAGADDFKTQPTGAAGGRIGIGVIGIAKKE